LPDWGLLLLLPANSVHREKKGKGVRGGSRHEKRSTMLIKAKVTREESIVRMRTRHKMELPQSYGQSGDHLRVWGKSTKSFNSKPDPKKLHLSTSEKSHGGEREGGIIPTRSIGMRKKEIGDLVKLYSREKQLPPVPGEDCKLGQLVGRRESKVSATLPPWSTRRGRVLLEVLTQSDKTGVKKKEVDRFLGWGTGDN